MPSPFPGMDPYLENPGLWPDFHHEFLSTAKALLSAQLRPKYFVRIEERVDNADQANAIPSLDTLSESRDMPSPFPGMDPYLENPGLWLDFHHRFITIASDQIVGQIRPKYFVRIEERAYITDDSTRSLIVPDLRLSTRPDWEDRSLGSPAAAGGGGNGFEVAAPIEVVTMMDDEVREARLEILDREGHAVVTVIELLSPANKVPGSEGRKSFKAKRDEVMNSSAHWVEVDLLRGGTGFRPVFQTPRYEYSAHVSRAERRPRGLLWQIRLSQKLPAVTIPLRPGDPDASLDLQAVLTTAYDRAGYDLTVDYTRDPVPPLTGEWPEWSDRLLKAKKLRPA